ncbi:hypothetical protein [uncultured Brevibacillus sp.]|uniref:hypothetical protein n=1 Tax=uncultured Brevibacillus sp. TaxID=169970 RepID=UPI00259193FE|nr:hypothetical protein [uncultured Brevibacillus sp.]
MGDALVADPVTAALLVRKGVSYHAASLDVSRHGFASTKQKTLARLYVKMAEYRH